MDAAVSTSLKVLGFKDLKPKQREVVEKFVAGNDVFVSLPTGSGKSLCYWILPLVFNHLRKESSSIVLVVSPLVALMTDQVSILTKMGVKSVYVGGADDTIREDIKQGSYSIIFFSPECLLKELEWRDMLHSHVYQTQLVAFVIDEAHCVKMWGKQFRREFSNLSEVRSLIPTNVHLMALTATATRTSRTEICRVLGMPKPEVVSISPNKPNIKYYVCVNKNSTMEDMFDPIVRELKINRKGMDKILIFCRTYDDVTKLYFYFKIQMGLNRLEPPGAPDLAEYRLFDMYTACTHPNLKPLIVGEFTKEGSVLRIVIATIAFGMGLNCPDIRRVIHWNPPDDIESYIQETGRGGRDGLQSSAILYITTAIASYVTNDMSKYCMTTDTCRRSVLFNDFDGIFTKNVLCQCCDVCALKCKCEQCQCNDD